MIEARLVQERGERRIAIACTIAERELCASLNGSRWKGKEKVWTIPATASSALQFQTRFAGLEVTLSPGVQELIERGNALVDAQHAKGAVDLPDTPTRTTAWEHQRRAFAFAKELDAAMLAMDMGTGKSLVTIALWEEFNVRRGLIICPVSVVGVWPKQFRIHAQDPDEWEIIAPRPGTMPVAKRMLFISNAMVKAERLGKRVAVIVNYESAWRPPLEHFLADLTWDDIHLDESHRAKSPGGRSSLFITRLRSRANKRGAGSGTPMPHSPADIYAQFRFLDPGIFGTSKNRFMNRYAVQREQQTRDGRSYKTVEDWQNMDEFTEKFKSISFVISKEEALPDLPEKMPAEERTFMLGPKALRAYKLMSKDLIAEMADDKFIVAANSLSKVMALRQITSGHAKLDDGTIIHLDDGRAKLLTDILDDVHEPVVVFAVFKEDLKAIEGVCKHLGRSYGELSGRRKDGITEDATMAAIDVLGCQLKSGGVGIDLTRSSLGIYYSVGYELGDYVQSTDRLHRPGQTRPCRYIHLVAENAPQDQVMYEALAAKKDVVDAIYEAAKEKRL